jgi:hypothetical protein
MRTPFLTSIAVMTAMAAVMSGQAGGPVKSPAPAAGGLPRTADGHPDLQGTYDLGTITPLERRAGSPLVLTEEDAKKAEQQVAERSEKLNAPIDANRAAPPTGGDGSPGPYGNVGGYNNFWLDPGSRFTTVDGRKRASLLVDPPDGRVPALTDSAKKRNASRLLRTTSDEAIKEDDPGFEGADAYDDPEQRPLGERCLIGFSSTSGPPILPTYFFNNLHQIVQTQDTVVILTEMVHDARIVRMNAPHLAPSIRKWMGDSVGRWEGDTLVIDTTRFKRWSLDDNYYGNPKEYRMHSDAFHTIERLRRTDANTIAYDFTVDDPKIFTASWTENWELKLHPEWEKTGLYEMVCEENNRCPGGKCTK